MGGGSMSGWRFIPVEENFGGWSLSAITEPTRKDGVVSVAYFRLCHHRHATPQEARECPDALREREDWAERVPIQPNGRMVVGRDEGPSESRIDSAAR